jgi:hypothetical protein
LILGFDDFEPFPDYFIHFILLDSVPQNFGSHQKLPFEKIFFACPQVPTDCTGAAKKKSYSPNRFYETKTLQIAD